MTKHEFLTTLREALVCLPQSDMHERIGFYAEMIDDRMEEGVAEAEAVAAVGSVEEIVLQIVDEYSIGKLVKQRMKPKRRLSAWEILLLVLGSPVWVSLLIAAFAVLLSLYVSLWAVIVSFWAVFVSLAGGAFGGLAGGVVSLCYGETPSGLVLVSAALVCAGLAIFSFYGCKAATKGAARLTKRIVVGVKRRCMRKEAAQ